MTRLPLLGVCLLVLISWGCTGGAAGSPSDDIGDILVLTHSPGNGDTVRNEDSTNGHNALENPTLTNPGAVTIVFTNSINPTSVLNPDPQDEQGTRNIRLFYFDRTQGPFDPKLPFQQGVNPPGANVIVPATTTLTTTNQPNDTLIIRPTDITSLTPMQPGQYSVVVTVGVQGADGDGMKGREYFFFYRVGDDDVAPVVVSSSPAPGDSDVDPTAEIRITMSETIRADTVNLSTMKVEYQPAFAAQPITVPGEWFVDGGNGPGNNFPAVQLDFNGNPGFSGQSARNGVDVVFRPALDAFPPNMRAEDPNDPFCTLVSDPPQKGNRGMPRGQAITVTFVEEGIGVTDTAGNEVGGTPESRSFTFNTVDPPDPVWAPSTTDAIYYADTIGMGVIEVDPTQSGYIPGPNPARSPNEVVRSGVTPNTEGTIVRVPVQDITDMTVDTRVYSAFYTFVCAIPAPNIWQPMVYCASRTNRGGEIIVVDGFNMESIGRFGTPSPGGVAVTAVGANGQAVVSNFSANTVTVFDIGLLEWYMDPNNFWATQNGLFFGVTTGASRLILNEDDFTRNYPAQRPTLGSPPGPPIIGTINVGISPRKAKITAQPFGLGVVSMPCPSPILSSNLIICSLNTGENTADFSELTNLNQSAAVQPDLDGVNLSSQPSDVAWSPFSFVTGAYYFYIASVGGTVELFASGFIANRPSVRPEASTNFAPNKIINNIGGLIQPTAVQWITSGNAVSGGNNGYTQAVLVAETGEDRLQQLAITAEVPSNLFQTINANHSSGQGPVDMTGDPFAAGFALPCSPRFVDYYVANAGEGTVRLASYAGGVIGTDIPVPGILLVASWWSR